MGHLKTESFGIVIFQTALFKLGTFQTRGNPDAGHIVT